MADVDRESVPVIAITAAFAAVVLLFVLFCNASGRKKDDKDELEEEKVEKNGKFAPSGHQQQGKKSKVAPAKQRHKSAFTHPWLCGSLKGHGSDVLDFDFSPNGKYVISCGDDRSLFLWSTKDFREREHKAHRGNVEFDHATRIRFSPDSKAFIVSLAIANAIRIFKIGKKPDGSFGAMSSVLDFDQHHMKAEVLSIGIASTGKYIMTAYTDTTIVVWDLKGVVLATIDTHQINNTCCMVSPCARFIASAGFTPDVKAWEVSFNKTGAYDKVVPAFDLKGHSAGVLSFSFSNDSARMVSLSKDGTWKLWDTSVQYKQGQDPRLLYTGQFAQKPQKSLIALSPDARTVAIAHGTSLSIYETLTGTPCEDITDLHTNSIRTLAFDNEGKYLLTCGDRHIHIFHNVPGYRSTIVDLVEKKKAASEKGARERFQSQINDAKSALCVILGNGDK